MFNEAPNNRLYNNICFDVTTNTLNLDNCNISEKCIKPVIYTLMKIKD